MLSTYEEWKKINSDVTPLIRSLKSSIPEQYVGFYLYKVFGDEVEYQKQFEWLGKQSLDIYIPSLKLAIEYDGEYYHRNKFFSGEVKTSICRSYGIYLIHIQEMKATQEKSRKRNVISYYYEKKYKNIDVAIQSLFTLINKKYGEEIQIDINIDRDNAEFISYVQDKYHKKTIAYVWPESKEYWLEEKSQLSVYDVFYTNNNPFLLKCPHCQKEFTLFTRYFHHRRSLVPCECEYKGIEEALKNVIKKYKETGEIPTFDDSLISRRLYDKMEQRIEHWLSSASKEEMEMYKKIGFESPKIDFYLIYLEH